VTGQTRGANELQGRFGKRDGAQRSHCLHRRCPFLRHTKQRSQLLQTAAGKDGFQRMPIQSYGCGGQCWFAHVRCASPSASWQWFRGIPTANSARRGGGHTEAGRRQRATGDWRSATFEKSTAAEQQACTRSVGRGHCAVCSPVAALLTRIGRSNAEHRRQRDLPPRATCLLPLPGSGSPKAKQPRTNRLPRKRRN
jgi:hypothetical protein